MKEYVAPEWEILTFSAESRIMTESSCSADCPDDCTTCFYLVCQPQDVIIG